MTFEFTATRDFDFLSQFGAHIQAPVHEGLLVFPASLGKGFIRKFKFGADMKVVVHQYELNQDLTILRKAADDPSDLVTIFFYNNEQRLHIVFNDESPITFSRQDSSAIQLTSNDLNSTVSFPAHHLINYVVVGMSPKRLKDLLGTPPQHPVLRLISGERNSFLLMERMDGRVIQELNKITSLHFDDHLSGFFLRNKTHELLYLLFQKLVDRDEQPPDLISQSEADTLITIQGLILRDLSVPPVLRELARIAAMSETKLKKLFKQTFGSSIYNYYQQARMDKAALLLKETGHTVAEVGYELGFTNLSHFSRLFERHHGTKPKQYSGRRPERIKRA